MSLSKYADILNDTRLSEPQYAKVRLMGSYMEFIQVFYEIRNGREFVIPRPVGRESHVFTVARELKSVFNLETMHLIINIPPGHYKSTMLVYWVAWCMARYPDCNFIYVSHAYTLAEKHTSEIKAVMSLPYYKELFGVSIATDSKAKGAFKTSSGGAVMAFGSSGAVVGQDAGFPNCDRFSGCVIMDDMHKPDDVHSDTMRESVIDNFRQTISQRPRGVKVPMIFIGQRLHEEDLPAYLISGKDGRSWKSVILRSIDEAGNALNPLVYTKEFLLNEQEKNPYVFWSQHQQEPSPAGGGIFKTDWIYLMPQEPEIQMTFITADTAETDKTYNDATVFSFWGLHRVKFGTLDTGEWGLHWISCREIRVEPKDLENEFFDFYAGCMRHKIKPKAIAIEKKSTGVTLSSTLKAMQGLKIIAVDHNAATGSKIQRFLDVQSIVASKKISILDHAPHRDLCLNHLKKITANNSHRHDDVADTMQMAIQISLIDGTLLPYEPIQNDNEIASQLYSSLNKINSLRVRQ